MDGWQLAVYSPPIAGDNVGVPGARPSVRTPPA
jgi:hypothetical protein